MKTNLTSLPAAVRWTAVLLIAVLLALGSLSPSPAPPSAHHGDLWLHGLAYGSFAAVAMALFRPIVVPAVAVLAYSLLLEGLQGLAPGRVPSWSDAVANATGVLLVVAVALIGRRLRGADQAPPSQSRAMAS